MPTTTDARFWDRTARKYAASKIGDMAGYERTLEHTRRYLKASDAVYEFGCGTGTTALQLAPASARYVASDISGAMIGIGREKASAAGAANLTFEVGAPETAGWPDASFDVVLGFNVLHLVQARAEALRGVRRLLKSGGLFITKTPCLGEMNPAFRVLVPIMRALGQAPFVAFFTAAELEREIAEAGFEIIERARHGSKPGDPRPFLVAR